MSLPVAVGAPASASLPGSGAVLTSSNGQSVIKLHGDPARTSLTSTDRIRGAAWSPDGSQAVYVDENAGIRKLRFDDGAARHEVSPAPGGAVRRSSPSWWVDGSRIVWAEKTSASARWYVTYQGSTGPLSQGWLSPRDDRHYLNPDAGPGERVVFQRQEDDGAGQPTGPSAVMLYDGTKPVGPVTLVDENGSNPSISPDGSRVAFVRAGRIVVSDLVGANEVPVTPEGDQYDDPTWSPDGATLAFSKVTATAARPVHTAPADGSAAPVAVAGLDGVPAYQPHRRERVARLSGASRFDTAVAVSQARWRGASAVVLARSDIYADALSGAALAAAKGGPLLLTPPTGLAATTQAELERVLLPGHGTVYLLGSTGALSKTVEDQVRALGYHVQRLAGPDRFATSVAIAKAITTSPTRVLAATGMNYPDALAAGPATGAWNLRDEQRSAVLLLTQDGVMPPVTKAYLDSVTAPGGLQPLVYGIGLPGQQAVYGSMPEYPYIRGVAGASRYETAYLVGLEFFKGPRFAGFATGTNWPDALTGGALMGELQGPLLLTPGADANLDSRGASLLREASGSVHTGLVFGSAAVVASTQQAQIGVWLGGPLGSASVTNPTDVMPEIPTDLGRVG